MDQFMKIRSRQKYILSALSIPTLIIALSLSISNAKDSGDWLDVNNKLQFNFSSLIRPIPIWFIT